MGAQYKAGTWTLDELQALVDQSMRTRAERDGVSFEAEFTVEPHVAEVDGNALQVIFEGRPGSRLWKDLMVAVLRDIEDATATQPPQLHDLVSGRIHP